MTVPLTGWAIVAGAMALLWARQTRTRNATSVDAAWASAIGALAIAYAVFTDGELGRRLLVAGLAALWAFRLAFHVWAHRVRGQTEEDGRYAAMRAHWAERAQRNLFVFYQGQAFVAVVFSLPMLAAMQRGGPLDFLDAAGLLVAILAILFETVADRQLARWRAAPENRGRTCRTGLWRYSRHPNYFFEWTHWFAYILIARGAWMTLLGPVLMLLFLFKLTGIPYTERQALKSRGDDYRAYQESTSVFIPWFPRRSER